MQILPNNNKYATEKLFFDFGNYWPFWPKKVKIKKNEENRQNPKFSEIFVYRYFPTTTKNVTEKLIFDLGIFWPFLAKKKTKLTKNEEIGKIQTV